MRKSFTLESLEANRTFSHYRINRKLGAGGMGEVYRATDTRLKREVAIKVLPEAFAADAEWLARFTREAQVLASLNHPNIAAIYGLEESDDIKALVLELVEGPTLDDRLRRSPISFTEALPIARQVAEALEYAHERGIVHRDLKPANIKITPEGAVKILDFGLAKAFTEQGIDGDLSKSPTLTAAPTHSGMILGTPAYMSPEQAQGAVVDKRTDIWAFGVVMYEVLSGRRLFNGASMADTLAAVLRAEIDWKALPTETPAGMTRLLQRCLARDRKRRLRDIGDARIEIEDLSGLPTSPDPVPSPVAFRGRRALLLFGGLIVAALAAGAILSRVLTRAPIAPAVIRVSQTLPSDQVPSGRQRSRLCLSPDGTKLVYVANKRLYLRSLDSLSTVELPGSDQAMDPFFSPDGKWIGFWLIGHIKKIPVNGGNPVIICSTEANGASWGSDDTILIGGVYSGILRVPASGGKPVVIVPPAPAIAYFHPQFLPDGRSFMYQRGRPGNYSDFELVQRSLENDDETVVLRGVNDFRYLKTGHLVYVQSASGQSSNLIAVAFDLTSRKIIGDPVTLIRNVEQTTAGNTYQFTVSENGTLAYLPAPAEGNGTRLVTIGRDGKSALLPLEVRDYSDPKISPDGRLVAVHLQGDKNDVWVADPARGTLTRLSYDGGEDETPVWSPDGRFVVWAGTRNNLPGESRFAPIVGIRGIFRRAADGSGQEELLWQLDKHAHVRDFLPDGHGIVLETQDPALKTDIWRLDLNGTPAATPYLQTQFDEDNSRLSPNGRWLAYVSDESGRREVYIQSFPQPGTKLPVSRSGGDQPVWSRDGRRIFFRGGGAIQEASFAEGSSPTVGVAQALFPDSFENPQAYGHTSYDVWPDGRFLLIQSPEAKQGTAPTEIVFVFNFFEEVKREVPTSSR